MARNTVANPCTIAAPTHQASTLTPLASFSLLPQPLPPDVKVTCKILPLFDGIPNMTVTHYIAAGSNGPDNKDYRGVALAK